MIRALIVAAAVAGCVRPADNRTRLDDEVGIAQVGGARIEVADGFAQIRAFEDGEVRMWAQAPSLVILLDIGGGGTSRWLFSIENCMPDAQVGVDVGATVTSLESPRPAVCNFEVDAGTQADVVIRVGPPDADVVEPFSFGVFGDIQTGMNRVDDVFEVLNADPDLRFVVMTGDIVETGTEGDYDEWLEKVVLSRVPVFATIGNHELRGTPELWHELFGLYNLHFDFKGVAYTLADSGNASLDPIVYDRLEGWLSDAADRIHVFGTHYPPLDPVGSRHAEFRSRREASKLLAQLAAGNVDVAFYGHIHSFYTYANAGIPSFISGGGGGIPERLDGIGRHILKVRADPDRGSVEVSVVRVD